VVPAGEGQPRTACTGRWIALLPHKPALEKHLKGEAGRAFELDYDLLLYDR